MLERGTGVLFDLDPLLNQAGGESRPQREPVSC